MKVAFIRAVRTYIQGFIGFLLVGWSNIVDVESAKSIAGAAALAAIPATLTLIQNLLETFDKNDTIPGSNPDEI